MFPSRRHLIVAIGTSAVVVMLFGCANPGPPRPPSLQIPAPVHDLSATRRGAAVTLQFTLPQRTSDGTMLRSGTIRTRLCRAAGNSACVPIPAHPDFFPVPAAAKTTVTLVDELPLDLASGPLRPLTYRVQLANPQGKDAGFSDAAYAAAGSAPPQVTNLEAQGTRLGIVLRWAPTSDDARVLLERKDLSHSLPSATAPSKEKTTGHGQTLLGKQKPPRETVVLDAGADTESDSFPSKPGVTLDATAEPGTYRYSAERRRTVHIAGRSLEMWSGLSLNPPSSITFTLRDSFPPPVPTDLSVVGFSDRDERGTPKGFAVDLIWEPVEDQHLAGYKVYRDELRPTVAGGPGEVLSVEALTPVPVKVPAFHDATANGSKRYRYRVTSVDSNGNESDAATATLEPQTR